MFDDLTNTSLNKIPLSDVKAAPSENSPNDGGFNNEENLRWLTKKLVSKPFIIGDTEAELSAAFSATTDEDGNDIINAGMFSIDGYTFKLGDPAHISFDDETGGTFIPMDSRYAQRFVEGLVNQGTANVLTTNLEKVLLSDYNPNNYSTSTKSQLINKWKSAYTNKTCIGYLKFKYTGSYADELTVSTTQIKYKNTDIRLDSQVLIDPVNNPILSTDTTDQIWAKLKDTELGWKKGDNFAVVNSASDIDIYYGMFFKDHETWDTTINEYKTSQRIEFVDIFGLTFFYDNTITSSSCYPATQNTDVNLGGNTLLSGLPFNNCKLATYPKYLYNFEELYDNDSVRYTVDDTVTYTATDFPSYSTMLETLFDKKTTSELLTNYVPLGNPANIAKVETNLDYFCIKGIPDTLKKSYIGPNNETIYIPVSFMTSEGSLTPNGFLVNNTSTCNTYPVEGYLHFIKRLYWKATNGEEPTENNIKSVTVQQLCSWTTSDATYGNFKTNYQTYILPYISMYIHLCYCSLMDNVAYGYNNSGSSPTYDYESMKSIGCGVQLAASGYGVSTDFDTIQQYNGTEYNYDSDNNVFTPSTVIKEIHYSKNVNSDTAKITNFTTDEVWKDTGNNPLTFSYYVRALANTETNYAIQFDDPINYYRQCALTDNYVPLGNKNAIVSDVVVQRIDYTGNTFSMQYVNKKVAYVDTPVVLGHISYLLIDQYLMPTRPTWTNNRFTYDTLPAMFGTHNIKSLNGTGSSNSIINGMCYDWNEANWIAYIPCTATVKKDSHNYLRGKDFDQPNNYAGLELSYTLPSDVDNNTCYLYNLEVSTDLTTGTNDKEKPNTNIDINSKYIKRRREAIFHINKIYGPNYTTIQDIIKQEVNVDDLRSLMDYLKENSIIRWPNGRIIVWIGQPDAPGSNVKALTSLSANKYIELIVHMNPDYANVNKGSHIEIQQLVSSTDTSTSSYQTKFLNKLEYKWYFDVPSNPSLDRVVGIRIYNYGDTIDSNNIANLMIEFLGVPVLSGGSIDTSSCILEDPNNPGHLWIEWDGNEYDVPYTFGGGGNDPQLIIGNIETTP